MRNGLIIAVMFCATFSYQDNHRGFARRSRSPDENHQEHGLDPFSLRPLFQGGASYLAAFSSGSLSALVP
jgi:hypothetical protein